MNEERDLGKIYRDLSGIFVKYASEEMKRKCFKELEEKHSFLTVIEGKEMVVFI